MLGFAIWEKTTPTVTNPHPIFPWFFHWETTPFITNRLKARFRGEGWIPRPEIQGSDVGDVPWFTLEISWNVLKENHGPSWVCLKMLAKPHCTQWFCWSLSLWKMAISLGIYPTFSDKPSCWIPVPQFRGRFFKRWFISYVWCSFRVVFHSGDFSTCCRVIRKEPRTLPISNWY